MAVVPCTPVAPVRGVVTFDPTAFVILYPEFATVSPAQLNFNFARATLLLNNGCGSRVQAADVRDTLLQMLVAHITALTNGVNGQPPAGLVGRVSQAAEGTVNVSAEYSTNVGQSMAYYIQTKYGAMYWEATARFRTMFYIPAPPTCDGGNWPPGSVFTPLGPMGNGNCGWNGGSS